MNVYVKFIVFKFALFAHDELTVKVYENDPYRIWLFIQSILITSTNISKILFSGENEKEKKFRQEQKEFLRKILNISGNEQFGLRLARNHFEHFDERLEDGYRQSSIHNHNVVDGEIGGDNFIKDNKDVHYLRFFNNDRFIFRFRNEEYEIEKLKMDIIDLLNKVNYVLKKRHLRSFLIFI